MSKLSNLKPFIEPPPAPKPACKACNTFSPECLVPVGDEAVPMCWLCAHHVVEHGAPLERACWGECECTPWEIYPHREKPPRAEIVLNGDLVCNHADPKQCGACRMLAEKCNAAKTEHQFDREHIKNLPPAKLQQWVEEAHKQMSKAQRAAVKKRLN